MCSRKDCLNVAVWQVGFTFKSVLGGPTASAQLGVLLCEIHKKDFKFEDLFPPESIRKMQEVFLSQGLAEPDPSTFKVKFIPIV